MYCDAHADVHMNPHSEKNNSHITCGNDKNERFYNNQFGSHYSYRNYPKPTHYSYRNYPKPTIIRSNIQVFHRFRKSS